MVGSLAEIKLGLAKEAFTLACSYNHLGRAGSLISNHSSAIHISSCPLLYVLCTKPIFSKQLVPLRTQLTVLIVHHEISLPSLLIYLLCSVPSTVHLFFNL